MAYPLTNDYTSCVNAALRDGRTCVSCYYSQTKGCTWQGTQACFNAGCVKLDEERYKNKQ